MEKRKIESAAELVNALELGVGVKRLSTILTDGTEVWVRFVSLFLQIPKVRRDIESKKFRYAEPVEVVELWGDKNIFEEVKCRRDTHKQTQIIQNGEIIWTKTEKI